MSDYTRVTVVGSARRATIVIPNDETVGAILPGLLDVLGERPAGVTRPMALTRLTGEPLDDTRSVAEQSVVDGELLRLGRLDEAPPPPEVTDVTDAVSESFGDRRDRWDDRARTAAGTGAIGFAALAAGLAALASPAPLPLVAALGAGAAALAAAVLGLTGLHRTAAGAVAAAVGLLPAAVPAVAVPLAAALRLPLVPVAVPVATGLAWLVLLLGTGVGRRSRAALLGCAIGAGGALLALGLEGAGLPLPRAAGVVAVAGVLLLGLLPAAAMNASGLTGLDDLVLTDGLAPRPRVLVTVERAYRTLTWTAVGLAATIAPALVVLLAERPGWAFALGATAALVVALRTRAFPLAAQVVALWTAVAAGVASGLAALPAPQAAGGFATAAAIVAVLAGVRPVRHRRAALRRVGTLLEALAVIALLPLLLGVFDVYPELFGAFR